MPSISITQITISEYLGSELNDKCPRLMHEDLRPHRKNIAVISNTKKAFQIKSSNPFLISAVQSDTTRIQHVAYMQTKYQTRPVTQTVFHGVCAW